MMKGKEDEALQTMEIRTRGKNVGRQKIKRSVIVSQDRWFCDLMKNEAMDRRVWN